MSDPISDADVLRHAARLHVVELQVLTAAQNASVVERAVVAQVLAGQSNAPAAVVPAAPAVVVQAWTAVERAAAVPAGAVAVPAGAVLCCALAEAQVSAGFVELDEFPAVQSRLLDVEAVAAASDVALCGLWCFPADSSELVEFPPWAVLSLSSAQALASSCHWYLLMQGVQHFPDGFQVRGVSPGVLYCFQAGLREH